MVCNLGPDVSARLMRFGWHAIGVCPHQSYWRRARMRITPGPYVSIVPGVSGSVATTTDVTNFVQRSLNYPDLAFLYFLAARSVLHSARRAVAHLEDPEVWAILKAGATSAVGPHEAARIPEWGPTRAQWLRAQKRLCEHSHELWDAYRPLALRQALAQGIFPEDETRSWSNPQRHQLIAADGTFLKSPTLARARQSVDLKTGEIRNHRVDPAFVPQREGGGTEVYGPKYVFFSARRGSDYLTRVFLDCRYAPHLHPGGEAAGGVSGALAIMAAAPGCMGLLYDGAMRGVHRDAIARHGGLVINKQHKGNLSSTRRCVLGAAATNCGPRVGASRRRSTSPMEPRLWYPYRSGGSNAGAPTASAGTTS